MTWIVLGAKAFKSVLVLSDSAPGSAATPGDSFLCTGGFHVGLASVLSLPPFRLQRLPIKAVMQS